MQLRIFKALAREYPQEYRDKLAADVEVLYDLSPTEATARAEVILREFIGYRTLLILAENLDEIFKGLGDTGQKKFRAFLQNYGLITIIATSKQLFAEITQAKYPFYGFFHSDRLDELSKEEAIELTTRLAKLSQDEELINFVESGEGSDRLKQIFHLVGGNHRFYVILSRYLSVGSLREPQQAIGATLDKLFTYYQSRVKQLSPQQRKIIGFLCDCEMSVSVKEIASKCSLTHQTASSQLKVLRDRNVVVAKSQGKNSLYRLRDPLLKLCYSDRTQLRV